MLKLTSTNRYPLDFVIEQESKLLKLTNGYPLDFVIEQGSKLLNQSIYSRNGVPFCSTRQV
jgi:hypothetical protein